MLSSTFPPTPSVEHITTLFRRIDAGRILIPAFQREFVWELSQILELLESVYQGYPIGSILLWTVDTPVLHVSQSESIPFPRIDAVFPASFVLDGLQRLSSLYGTLRYGDVTNEPMFDIAFDLETRSFMYDYSRDDPNIIPLNALFNPKRLIESQGRLLYSGLEEKLEALTELQQRFQSYMLPLVTLSEKDINQVVTIFERVNSTGTRLSRVDFLRAITWSSTFDLSEALEGIRESASEPAFPFSDDTVVKVLGLIFDIAPTAPELLTLRNLGTSELKEASSECAQILADVAEFLRSELGVHSIAYVGYEGILTILAALRRAALLDTAHANAIRAWFLSLTFTEALQGRPDNHVARLVDSVVWELRNVGRIATDRPSLDQTTLIRRRMLRGKALTSGFVAFFAKRGVRSLVDFNIIETADITGSYDARMFQPVVPFDALVEDCNFKVHSARLFANVVFCRRGEYGANDSMFEFVEDAAGSEAGRKALASQLISEAAVQAIRDRDSQRFLSERAKSVQEAVLDDFDASNDAALRFGARLI